MNPIQPLTSQPADISVTVPISQALETVKRVLFRPFDLGRWFVIGFGAWLAHLGERGFGGGNFGGGPHFGHSSGSLQRELGRARDYVMGNLAWIIPVVMAVVALALILWVVFTWLSSRGKFMFLHCVALNKAEVQAPWEKFAGSGTSLWWFRLGLGLAGMLVTLPLMALVLVPVFKMVMRESPSVAGIVLAAGALLAFIVAVIAFAVIGKLTTDFVVPVMFLRQGKCLQAWRELRELLQARFGSFVLYLLMQIVLGIGIGLLVLIVVLVTCCIAGCFLAIPYIGTVLLLPVLVFRRAYSVHFLAQFGREYDVFPPEDTPAAPMTSG